MTRRIILFVLAVALTLATGVALPRQWLKPVFNYSSYYFMLTAFVIWMLLIVRITYGRIGAIFKAHYTGLLLSVGIMALAFHLLPPQFKILADETNLVGVSMAMHKDRTASVPLQGLALDYADYYYTGGVDQRPPGYPFFISLCHALLGYSAYNGFVVNFAAGVLALFFLYLLLSRALSRYYGILGILLMSACPILLLWSTSSGFETINLFFVVLVLFLVYWFSQSRQTDQAELLFLSLVLLAYCRYESAIFIIGLVVLWPFFISRDMIIQYRLPTLLCPFLLLPLIWQRRFSFFSANVMSGDTRQMADQLFGVANFADHFSPNMFVIFGMDTNYGFLPIVFALALSGLYCVVKRLFHPVDGTVRASRSVIVYGLVCGVSLFLLYSAFYWGNFMTDMDNRLTMVFLPFLILPAVYAVYRTVEINGRSWKGAVFLLAIIQIIYYWPVAERQKLIQGKSLTYEYNRVLDYIENNYDLDSEKLLIVSDRTNFYTIHKMGSVGFDFANRNVARLRLLKQIYYDHILVLQRPNPRTGKIHPIQVLSDSYQMRPLTKIPIEPDYCVSILAVDRIQE